MKIPPPKIPPPNNDMILPPPVGREISYVGCSCASSPGCRVVPLRDSGSSQVEKIEEARKQLPSTHRSRGAIDSAPTSCKNDLGASSGGDTVWGIKR